MMVRILSLIFGFILIGCGSGSSKDYKSTDPNSADESFFFHVMPKSFGKAIVHNNDFCDKSPPQLPEGLKLSNSFLNNCSGCHGSAGQGTNKAPNLQSFSSAELYEKIVRSGKARMPKFSTNLYSKTDLLADFELLKNKNQELILVPTAYVPISKTRTINENEFRKVMKKGLLAWRTPGARGACAACHGPDGIDLARIAYPNSSILRRAMGQGLDPELSINIVEMIEAQRNRNDIVDPCNPLKFRPLQPGIAPLTGNTKAEKDLGILNQLSVNGIDFNIANIDDFDSASLLADRFAQLDVSKIAIGIELNRWAEDEFHGSLHKSSAEWLPELPLEPSSKENEKTWIALQNSYLEPYGVKDLWVLIEGVKLLNTRRFSDGGVGERLAKEKYKSVLLMQHLLRIKDMQMPDLLQATSLSKFFVWETAQISNVMLRGCADSGSAYEPFPCWDYPKSFYTKMGTDPVFLMADLKKLNLPWLVAGFMQDPALQLTEGGDAQMQHLYEAFNRSSNSVDMYIHQIYFGLTRLVKSVDALDLKYPTGGHLDKPAINGCWNIVNNGLEQWSHALLPNLRVRGFFNAESFASEEYRTKTYSMLHTSNMMILNLILHGLTNSNIQCVQDLHHISLTEFVDTIHAFEKDMNLQTASELDPIVEKIKEVLIF